MREAELELGTAGCKALHFHSSCSTGSVDDGSHRYLSLISPFLIQQAITR